MYLEWLRSPTRCFVFFQVYFGSLLMADTVETLHPYWALFTCFASCDSLSMVSTSSKRVGARLRSQRTGSVVSMGFPCVGFCRFRASPSGSWLHRHSRGSSTFVSDGRMAKAGRQTIRYAILVSQFVSKRCLFCSGVTTWSPGSCFWDCNPSTRKSSKYRNKFWCVWERKWKFHGPGASVGMI